MNRQRIISSSRKHYRRYYRLVVVAITIMVAVLTGSLLLGDSVRATLSERVDERLGSAETVITSGMGVMDERVLLSPILANAHGYLLTQGFVSADGKMIPVYVWGTDTDSIADGEALINEPLYNILSPNTKPSTLNTKPHLALHLPAHSLVPKGSLFVSKAYSTQMRVSIKGVKDVKEGGNILLKNEQTRPLNVFVNRKQLCMAMQLVGKVNVILADDYLTEDMLASVWKPEYSGFHVTDSTLTYDGVFIPDEIVRAYSPHTTYLAYLVNEIICKTDTMPYSFVTATNRWKGEPLSGRDMILSDYAAKRLHVSVGDSVRMAYFHANDLKNLETKEMKMRVKAIAPLSDFMGDSLLTANFPGLTNVDKCTDWDSDLPINMDHIHKSDEDFWHRYRQTPKAIVAYDAVKADWSNSFGSATALRFDSKVEGQRSKVRGERLGVRVKGKVESGKRGQKTLTSNPSTLTSPPTQGDSGGILNSTPSTLNSKLSVFNLQRQNGMLLANSGTDFSGLFMALGFFIILSAILLMLNPLTEMYAQRSDELRLYAQLGFTHRTIRWLMFRESFSIILLASPLGVLTGVLYSAFKLWLLGNVWSGATHTEGFTLHVNALTLFLGWLIGIIVCALSLWGWLWNRVKGRGQRSKGRGKRLGVRVKGKVESGKREQETLTSNPSTLNSPPTQGDSGGLLNSTPSTLNSKLSICLCLCLGLVLCNVLWLHNMVVFIICGLMWIVSFGFLSPKHHRLAFYSLALGVFAVFAVGLNRPDFSDKDKIASATGGYDLYVDCRVPVQYDLNNGDVKRKLSLLDLPSDTHILQFLRHEQDEASCMNLNRVVTPTVLGTDIGAMQDFGIAETRCDLPCVYVDEEALTWSMNMAVGDTIIYKDGNGNDAPVLIAGTYPTGILHGNAIMSRKDFRSLWPRESGTGVMLVKTRNPDAASEVLSVAMSEYGLDIHSTQERLRMFFEVTDTYLLIFLTLGALGLLLGIFCLIIVVRKNLVASQTTIELYICIGFTKARIRQILFRENIITPLFAVLTGASGAMVSLIGNGWQGIGFGTMLIALLALIVICVSLIYGIRGMIQQLTINN